MFNSAAYDMFRNLDLKNLLSRFDDKAALHAEDNSPSYKTVNVTNNKEFKDLENALSKLLTIDIKPDKIVHEYVDLVSQQDFELTRCAFNSIQFFFDNHVAVSKISTEDLQKFSKEKMCICTFIIFQSF